MNLYFPYSIILQENEPVWHIGYVDSILDGQPTSDVYIKNTKKDQFDLLNSN